MKVKLPAKLRTFSTWLLAATLVGSVDEDCAALHPDPGELKEINEGRPLLPPVD